MKKKLTQTEMKKVLLKSIKGILLDEGIESKEVTKRIKQLEKKSYKALNEAYDGYVDKANERGKGIFIPPAPGAKEIDSERVQLQMKLDELRGYSSEGLLNFSRDILRYHVDARQCYGDIFRQVAYKVQEQMGLGDAPRVKERLAKLEKPETIENNVKRSEEDKVKKTETNKKKTAAKKATTPSKPKVERGPSYQDKLRELFKKKTTHLCKEDISKSIGADMQNTGTAISLLKNKARCGKGDPMTLVLCKVTKLYYREDGTAPKLTKEQKEAAKAKAAPKKETPAAKKPAAKKTTTKKPAAKGGAGSKKK